MINIHVNDDLDYAPPIGALEALAVVAFKRLTMKPKEESFGIHFTNDEEIQTLNAQYRGYDKPTDVLSFEADVFDPEDKVTYLGDIIISVETMQKQAESAGHSQETETLLLVTHGFLHLVGFDHSTTVDKEEMWALQAEILNLINVSPNKIPED